MARDDWKYYDDDIDEEGKDAGKETASGEIQCGNCLHWVERGAVVCPWCGKALGEKEKGRP